MVAHLPARLENALSVKAVWQLIAFYPDTPSYQFRDIDQVVSTRLDKFGKGELCFKASAFQRYGRIS
jgi:hypothetical protein